MNKDGLIFLAQYRRLPYTEATLKSYKKETLLEILGEIQPDEIETFQEINKNVKESEYYNKSKEKIEIIAKLNNVFSQGVSKFFLIHKILGLKSIIQSTTFDEDQKNVFQNVYEHTKVLIHAGPGAGKTTTLVQLPNLSIFNGARILFLAYNKNASFELEARFKRNNISINSNSKITDINCKGLFIMTFDKYAFRRLDTFTYSNSFSETFYRGVSNGIQQWESFDLCIIDELQDIQEKHVTLINQIQSVSKHVVCAGDPRQEIYQNAHYMTDLYNTENDFFKCSLRFNHRSSKKVVQLLNILSKEWFSGENIHVDQISTNEEVGSVEASINTDINDLSQNCANFLTLDHENILGDGYVISPISVKKYKNTSEIIQGIRQNVFNNVNSKSYAKLLIDEDSKYDASDGLYSIGNSFSLKGTEKQRVAIIQGDLPYTSLNISPKNLKKLLYVAISRAKTHLHIFLNNKLNINGFFVKAAILLNCQVAPSKPFSSSSIVSTINVVEDLCNSNALLVETDVIDTCDPLDITLPEAPDYLGILVEGVIANGCNLLVPHIYKFSFSSYNLPIFIFKDFYEDAMIISNLNKFSNRHTRLKHSVENILADNTIDNEIKFARIKYTIEAGTLWTLGNNISTDSLDISNFLKFIPDPKSRNTKYQIPIMCHRSNIKIGEIVMILDIDGWENLYEIKHAADDKKHNLQCALYGALLNKSGTLINSKSGIISKCKTDPKYANLLARSTIGMKQAIYRKSKIENPLNLAGWSRILVSVDIETHDNNILEIGAIAYDRFDKNIIGLYHEICTGVICSKHQKPNDTSSSYYNILDLCGFESINYNETKKHNKQFIIDFQTWCKQFSNFDLLQFSGNDAKALGLENETNRDAYNAFRSWIPVSRSGNSSLESAMYQIFGRNVYAPHRAFEDALATLMLIMTISKI